MQEQIVKPGVGAEMIAKQWIVAQTIARRQNAKEPSRRFNLLAGGGKSLVKVRRASCMG